MYRSHLRLVRHNPAAASPGDRLFALDLAGRGMVGFDVASGAGTHDLYAAQPARFCRRIRSLFAQSNSATPELANLQLNTTGNVQSRSIATTSLVASMQRIGFTSPALLGGSTGWRHGSNIVCRNTAQGIVPGGFFFAARFAQTALTTNARFFCGLSATTSVLSARDPSENTNQIGVGYDSSDQTFMLMTCGPTANAQKFNAFGISSSYTGVLDVILYSARGSTAIGCAMRTASDSATWQTGTVEPSKAPASLAMLGPHIWMNSGPTFAQSVGFDLSHVYLETEY
jgi:hypothetical protein